MIHLATLNRFFLRYKWHFFLGILFVILTNYFRILSPQITGYVVNTVVHSIGGKVYVTGASHDILVRNVIETFESYSFSGKVFYAGIILIALALISGFFMFLMRQTIIVMSRHIEFDQKNEIFAHYQKLDAGFYKSHSTGDLMNRISEDVSRVRMYTGPAIMYFINLAAVIGFSIFFMLRSDVKLTIVALSPLPILAFTIYFVNTIINRKSERIQSLLSDLTTNAQESYSGIRVIKSFVQESSMAKFFNRNSEKYRSSALSLAKTEAIYFPSIALLIGLSTLITIMVGSLDVVNNVPGATVGKIAEFVMYIQMLTFPVSAIGWTASMTQRAATSQKRINEFLLTASAINDKPGAVEKSVEGHISFRQADFTYPNTGVHALKKIDLNIRKGEKIAITGKTGSGKSTIAAMLLRMYDLQGGELLMDGINIKDLKLDSLRSQVSYVPQEVFLFSDTIYNNIAFGNNEATKDRIIKAAHDAGILKEIEALPDGFDTVVGERGVTLSGGQKQRISIARALVKDPGILILDDCLSAVDAKTEKHILGSLAGHLEDRTAIIITHRIFTLLRFDRIIVMDEGRIAEQGTHEELMAANTLYRQIYNRQQDTSS